MSRCLFCGGPVSTCGVCIGECDANLSSTGTPNDICASTDLVTCKSCGLPMREYWVTCKSCGLPMREYWVTCGGCGHIHMTRQDRTPILGCPECGVATGHVHHKHCNRGEGGGSLPADSSGSIRDSGCPECGAVGEVHYTHCSRAPHEFMYPPNPKPDRATTPIIDPEPPKQGMLGWTCPCCGRGNSPFTSTCPCLPLPILMNT